MAAAFIAPIVDPRPDDLPWSTMTWPPAANIELRGHTVVLAPAVPERDADELFAALDTDAVWQHVAGRPTSVDGMARVLQLKTDVRNVRSQKAIARLGASYEGTLRRYQRRADGTVRDTVLFSVLAEEWPTVRDRLLARLAE